MIVIKYNPNDLRYLFLTGDDGDLRKLEGHLNKIPSYMYLPSFNKMMIRPVVFLNKLRSEGRVIYYCHSGLWREVCGFCENSGIEYTKESFDDYFKYSPFQCSYEDFYEVVRGWNLNLAPRDYQVKSAWKILQYRQSLSQLATRAGKTLIAYMVFRYALEHGAHNILMIVPNITLVKQGVEDMKEYKEFFQTETVWAKGEYCECANLTIGTFQSLIKRLDRKSTKYNPKFFDKFDVILCDEAHTAKCKSINDLLSQQFMKQVKLKFGFSGSLPEKSSIESYTIQSLMGPMIQDISSKELMDQGFITPIDITQVRVSYDDEDLSKQYIEFGEYLCSNYVTELKDGKRVRVKRSKEDCDFTMKEVKELPVVLRTMKGQLAVGAITEHEYIDAIVQMCKAQGSNLLNLEQMLVHHSQKRVRVMDELIESMDKNCIVFAHHQEYLKFLESHFKERFPGRHVYMIQGSTSPKKREDIIKALLDDKDAILVASYGCVGTGITLKNIDYGIFAQSFKSQIINKQSMGRGLCLANDKDKYRLYDIIDVFPTKRLFMQGLEKVKLYKREKFEYRIIEK